MESLQEIFNYHEKEIRVIIKNGEPWWVARDVCDILEIANPTQALSRLDEDERSMFNIGRQGNTNIVNEYGLYSLIMGSRKPEAKQFKRWITHDVIPSIRKTGGYITDKIQPKTPAEMLLMYAEMLVEQEKRMKIVEEKQTILENKQDKMISYLVQVPKREAVNNKIKELSRVKYMKNQEEARAELYNIFKAKYGIDIMKRVKNKKDEINKERINQGKRPYESSTLKTKVSGMDIIEELGMLKELNEIVIGMLSEKEPSIAI